MPWEDTEEFIRSGHRDSDDFDADSLRTITVSEEEGIKAVVGCPKGQFKDGECQVGTEVQSFLFSKEKGWTLEKAKAWFKDQKAKESFSWTGSIKEMPGVDNLIRGQALHPLRTIHPDEWPEVREYLEEELEKSVHTLVGVPLILDHCQILDGKVLGAEYEDGAIEYVAQLNVPNVVELIRNGAIKHCSVEFEWKSLDQVNGVAPRGIKFTGLSLLRMFQPGDPQTTVEVWEGIVKQLKEAKLKSSAPASHGAKPAGGETGESKMSKEKRPKTLEGRIAFLETSKLLKEQELSKEEIEAKLNELTQQRQELENQLQQIAEEEQPKRDEIWQKIDLISAQLSAYEEALAAVIAGTAAPPQGGSVEEFKEKLKKYPEYMQEKYVELLEAQTPLNQLNKLLEAEWDTEYINDLPDSAFAYIEPGGEKDEQGKTTPRSLRHLPFKNAQGNIDKAHLVNALGRLPQTTDDVAKTAAKKKLCAAVETWNSEHEDKIESDVCGTAEESNQEPPEKDEHGCIVDKERYDEDQGKCVPIEAAEQQDNQEPGQPKTDKQRFMDHFGIDEEAFQKFYDLLGDELFKLLPEAGTKRQQQEKKKGLGEAILGSGDSSEPVGYVSVKKLESLLPHPRQYIPWGVRTHFVDPLRRLIFEAKKKEAA